MGKLSQVRKRIKWIDYVRAISMFLIIIGHTYEKAGFIQNLVFTVNVPIFFILSGYLTHQQPLKKVIKKGVYTLLIPYFVASLIMFIISILRHFIYIPLVNYQSQWYYYIIASLGGLGTSINFFNKNIPAIGAIWFLLAMYFGNIFYQILLFSSKKIKNKNIQNSFLLIISILISVLGFYLSKLIILPWSINAALISIIFYVSGHLIHEYKLLDVNYLFIIGLGLWALNSLLTPFWLNIGYTKNITTTILGAIGGSYVIMFIFKRIDKYNIKWLSNFGKCSMIALVFHVICINCFGDVNFIIKYLNLISFNPTMIEIIINIYRIILCVLVTNILAKNKFIQKIFAIVSSKK